MMRGPVDPSYNLTTLFDDKYPQVPYNFQAPPPIYAVGPIRAILLSVSNAVAALLTAMATAQAGMTVQQATGIYLDAQGVLYGVARLSGELDPQYAARILAALTAGKLTIPAIQAVVSTYFASQNSQTANPPTAYVYDLQSRPDLCAIDAANGNPIQIFQFVIEIEDQIPYSDSWFLDYNSYLTNGSGDPLTLPPNTVTYSLVPPSSDLAAVVAGVKAADTQPVYKTVLSFDN